jgi:hypothetical protein
MGTIHEIETFIEPFPGMGLNGLFQKHSNERVHRFLMSLRILLRGFEQILIKWNRYTGHEKTPKKLCMLQRRTNPA